MPDYYLSIMSSDYYYINQKKNILKLGSHFFEPNLVQKLNQVSEIRILFCVNFCFRR
jgi:hypothetical protein